MLDDIIQNIHDMEPKARNIKLCQLSVKEHMGALTPTETIELETIQMIRRANGEIAKVVKSRLESGEEIPKICGTCKHWKTCIHTKSWRINQPCSSKSNIKWEPINESD